MSCLISVPDLPLGGVLCSFEYIACARCARYALRILGSEVHPSRVHGLKHFFGRSGVALRDAELFERFRPPCTRDCKGFPDYALSSVTRRLVAGQGYVAFHEVVAMARNVVQFQKGLSEPAFEQRYGSEEQCRAIVIASRWPRGFECPACGGRQYAW